MDGAWPRHRCGSPTGSHPRRPRGIGAPDPWRARHGLHARGCSSASSTDSHFPVSCSRPSAARTSSSSAVGGLRCGAPWPRPERSVSFFESHALPALVPWSAPPAGWPLSGWRVVPDPRTRPPRMREHHPHMRIFASICLGLGEPFLLRVSQLVARERRAAARPRSRRTVTPPTPSARDSARWASL